MRNIKCKHGFSIAEMLVALAITGIILAAVAVAFNASVINYNNNEDIFKSLNGARQAMLRITAQLRTADAVDPNSPANECALVTAGSQNVTYRYDSGDNTLYIDQSGSSYALCENVTAMTFTRSTATEDGVTYVKSVQISITVQIGGTSKKIASAVVIRRNLG